MSLFPVSFIQDLKAQADIVHVVQERVPLRRSGAAWTGLCPFHGEKTPSFQVNGDKGVFHCFGCGVGGDVIKFIELFDKVTFPEAVRQLAALEFRPDDRDLRKALVEFWDRTADFAHQQAILARRSYSLACPALRRRWQARDSAGRLHKSYHR